MSDMNCPFCQKELRPLAIGWCCDCGLCADKELWQRLIRTRKALDVAVDALKDTNGYLYGDYRNTKWDLHKTIRQTLEQITALEQKENKI